MKFTFTRSAFVGIAMSLLMSFGTVHAQLGQTGGTTGQGNTGGFGATTVQGNTGFGSTTGQSTTGQSTAGFGGATGAVGGLGGANTRLPGSFGGPGVTGSPLIELTKANPSSVFNNGQSVSGGSAFGTNAFSASTTGTAGGQGGSAIGGMGNIGFGGGRLGGLGGIGGLGGLGGLGGSNSAQAKKAIRPVVKPDIEVQRETPSANANTATARLGRLKLPKKLQGVTATVDGGTVVLRGQVATESDKAMMERLVKLEPGIDSVRNEVLVLRRPSESIQASPSR